jgi:ABC-type transport system involved in multi-copper enzyme maturation permease subunit
MTTITVTPDVAAVPRAIAVFRANVRAELTKLRSVRSTTWTLLTTVGIALGFGALVAVSQMGSWDNLDRAEQLRFDPTFYSLSGLWLAQLAVGVLGVLLITSEYATGQIRATLGATPQRATVLAAKAAAFTGVVLTAGLLSSFGAFFIGQAIFASKDLGVSVTDPGVLRAVVGGALYLAAVGLLGLGLGTILRRTAGAVAALVGVLVLVPLVAGFLPASFQESVGRFFPAQAGMAVFSVAPDPRSLTPWTGYGLFLAYVATALVIGGLLLTRRDA